MYGSHMFMAQMEVLKIPRNIRKMTVAEFESKFGGSVLAAVQSAVTSDVDEAIKKAKSESRVVKRPHNNMSSSGASHANATCVPSTPGRGSRRAGTEPIPATPATVRAPRRGEVMMSENGSPLAKEDTCVATVKKSKRGEGDGSSNNIALEFDSGNGEFMDLTAPGVMENVKADPAMKKTAANKLKNLQDEVAALMAQLNS